MVKVRFSHKGVVALGSAKDTTKGGGVYQIADLSKQNRPEPPTMAHVD